MYLGPKDLLQLSRLSKQFRSILASRSALFVWRTVFRTLNITCLTDMNELQIASFLYDKYCMACGRTMRCDLFLMLRFRLCPSCQTANLLTFLELRDQYQTAWDLIDHLPTSSFRYFRPEAELLIQKFLSLKKENELQFIDNVKQHTRAGYMRTTKYSLSTHSIAIPRRRTKASSLVFKRRVAYESRLRNGLGR
ncbi:hypothetical protein BYT27DRAFT_7187317 [Phlegmacium glaucopus]|nr:hypothetical protein BYT27DRAFT_7187317 [Phlegmacium glaucopus]